MKFTTAMPESKTEIKQTIISFQNWIKSGVEFDKVFTARYSLFWADWKQYWCSYRRPYFNVYPSLIKCLINTPLHLKLEDIAPSILHDIGVIDIRTPKGNLVPSFSLGLIPEEYYQTFNEYDPVNNPLPAFRMGVGTPERISNASLELYISDGEDHFVHKTVPFNSFADDQNGVLDPRELDPVDGQTELDCCLKIAVGLLLLASDDRYVEPILLNRDKDKKLTSEQHEVAVKRAKNRGVFGFNIGREIEISPHFRRPHFAIRWTGKGSAIPKLVPVKGAVINKKLLDKIPTGYQDDDSMVPPI